MRYCLSLSVTVRIRFICHLRRKRLKMKQPPFDQFNEFIITLTFTISTFLLFKIYLHNYRKCWSNWQWIIEESNAIQTKIFFLNFSYHVEFCFPLKCVPRHSFSALAKSLFSHWYSRHTWQTSSQYVSSEFMDDKRPIWKQFVWRPNFLRREICLNIHTYNIFCLIWKRRAEVVPVTVSLCKPWI